MKLTVSLAVTTIRVKEKQIVVSNIIFFMRHHDYPKSGIRSHEEKPKILSSCGLMTDWGLFASMKLGLYFSHA